MQYLLILNTSSYNISTMKEFVNKETLHKKKKPERPVKETEEDIEARKKKGRPSKK